MFSAEVSAHPTRFSFPGTVQTRIGIPSAAPDLHTKSPTIMAIRYVDIFGEGENVSVCFPSPGPGVSETILPFEIAVSPLSITSLMLYTALYAGSSKQGNAR